MLASFEPWQDSSGTRKNIEIIDLDVIYEIKKRKSWVLVGLKARNGRYFIRPFETHMH